MKALKSTASTWADHASAGNRPGMNAISLSDGVSQVSGSSRGGDRFADGKASVPFAVLRRLDHTLAPTRAAALEGKAVPCE